MLANKKIVVIGGTSGMGLSAVRAFRKAGASVIAVGLPNEHCALGEDANTIVLFGDAQQAETAGLAIKKCLDVYGGFDGLYHIAGGSGRAFGDGPLHEMSLNGWSKTIELNLTSVMLSNQAAIQSFLDLEKAGSILNMGSILAVSPSSHYFSTHAYAAAKAGIIGFTKSIAAYYAKHNIRVNVIAPGLVETPMAQRAAQNTSIRKFIDTKQPLQGGRIGQAGDLDGAAVYFMSDHSSFVTGQTLFIDGGWSISDGQYT